MNSKKKLSELEAEQQRLNKHREKYFEEQNEKLEEVISKGQEELNNPSMNEDPLFTHKRDFKTRLANALSLKPNRWRSEDNE